MKIIKIKIIRLHAKPPVKLTPILIWFYKPPYIESLHLATNVWLLTVNRGEDK